MEALLFDTRSKCFLAARSIDPTQVARALEELNQFCSSSSSRTVRRRVGDSNAEVDETTTNVLRQWRNTAVHRSPVNAGKSADASSELDASDWPLNFLGTPSGAWRATRYRVYLKANSKVANRSHDLRPGTNACIKYLNGKAPSVRPPQSRRTQ